MKNQGQNSELISPTALIYNHTHYDMLVFCDGSWDQTYRKTLRFLDRNVGTNILYIEKPTAFDPDADSSKFMMINDHIHVLRTNVPSIDAVFTLLPWQVRTKEVAVGWFASSDYAHFSELIRFNTIINDYRSVSLPSVQHKPAYKVMDAFAQRKVRTHFPAAS
ncbi:hypothetical protein HYN48_06930 [Flavobacterium magnum]|uniref:Uncharacterized protein n=1 Tax=Flavobacterium magnum TaxID=2162713 RepID=A0A2S0RGJ4_9FLAO|nr:hypothetical protein [Flavobacterium magnum]AWA29832.1 hypothetical protein HYN48_06930 [Flavobacterium magnum]